MFDKYEIEIQAFAKALRSGQDINGKDGLLTPLIKQITEAALAAELDQYLAQDSQPNRKNGASRKTIKTATGSFELDTPRDRNGSFESQAVKKYQTRLTLFYIYPEDRHQKLAQSPQCVLLDHLQGQNA